MKALGRLVAPTAVLVAANACAGPGLRQDRLVQQETARPGAPARPGRPPGSAPRFEHYPAAGVFRGEPAVPDLSSHPDVSRFGSAVWQGARRGPNFAGHYVLVSRSCGRLCREFVIVDARTGAVHPGLADTPPFRYRIDSRLIVFDPPLAFDSSSCGGCSAAYYVWNDPRLELLPPDSRAGSPPPPPRLARFVDSVRTRERLLLRETGPAAVRPSWDRLIIAARDGTQRVLEDRIDGDVVVRLHVFRGAVTEISQHLIEVITDEGSGYTLLDSASGRSTEIDGPPVVSPDRSRFATASLSASGRGANRVRIYRVTMAGPELEWSSEAWGGSGPVWLNGTSLVIDRVEGTRDAGRVRRTRVRLELGAGRWLSRPY